MGVGTYRKVRYLQRLLPASSGTGGVGTAACLKQKTREAFIFFPSTVFGVFFLPLASPAALEGAPGLLGRTIDLGNPVST